MGTNYRQNTLETVWALEIVVTRHTLRKKTSLPAGLGVVTPVTASLFAKGLSS